MADDSPESPTYGPLMHIQIFVDAATPLSGKVTLEDEPPVPFEGWLQLLCLLSDVLEPTKQVQR